MKIVFLLPGHSVVPVGGFRVVYEYANHLVSRGHDITVIHPRRLPNWKPPAPDYFRWLRRKAGYYIRGLLPKPKIDWQHIDERVNMLYVPEPITQHMPEADAVFATAWQTAELVVNYPSSKGQKFYLIQHYEIWNGPKDRVDSTWHSPMQKVVIAKWLFEKGLQLGVQPSDMMYIPNGINHDVFRGIHDIEKRPSRIAMMYSNLSWKGGGDGIKALEKVKTIFPDLQAILFGQKAKPDSIPDWIQYYENPKQELLVEEIYNRSAVYLCPSWTEGWHLPPAEAMACGCALITTDIGGIRDYAEHEKTALLSPPKDPEALAKNLLRILNDDNLRIQIAKAGNENIKKFKWEHSTDKLEKLLNANMLKG